MTATEQKRLQVLAGVLEGRLKVTEASGLMGVSERHAWRLLAAFRKEGVAALAHGNRGRTPTISTDPAIRDRVRGLAKGTYAGLNHTHLTELLEEREGIDLSRSTVRRILLSGGIKSPRKRRAPKHHSRRVRYPQEGMLLQIDGSKHDWLQGRGPYLTLIAAIDDATGTVPFALFRDQEDAHGYLLMLRSIIQDKGVPMALYSDRHGIFQRSPKEPESLEEQLRGRRDPTQFGRALQELGIELILAYTPQAKGRVERLFGTLQDRLVSEMRLAGATTAQQANNILWRLLPDFNRRFGVCAAQQGSAYRQLSADLSLDSVLCFKSTCVLWPTTIPCGSTPLHSNSYPTHTVLAMQGPQWRSRNVLTAAWSLSTQVRQSAVSQLPPRLSRSERAMAEGPQVQSTPRVQSMLLLTLLGSQQGQENRLRCRQQPRRPNGPTNLAPTTRGGESY